MTIGRAAGRPRRSSASGIAPTNPREAALLLTLGPGDYTAIVRGADGGTGIRLVEIYDVDQ